MTDPIFIDEHIVTASASQPTLWHALNTTLIQLFSRRSARPLARILGSNSDTSEPQELLLGQAIPGFNVTDVQENRRLELSGKHRFAQYRLVFILDQTHTGCELRAQTWAAFPGTRGRLYR